MEQNAIAVTVKKFDSYAVNQRIDRCLSKYYKNPQVWYIVHMFVLCFGSIGS